MRTIPFRRRTSDLLLAFLLPAAIFLAIQFRCKILPFGDLTLLYSDLDSQYVEFMAEYRRMLLGEGSLSWSWHAGLGLNFLAIIAYYLASPFNFLLILFPEDGLPLAVSLITVLKLGCAGASFAWYLQKRFGEGTGLIPVFAACYALSAYALGYAFNIMWLDALIWLPLLCSGIDRLLDSENKGMAALTLLFALSFLSQFYMAWMTGAFCVLYFLSRVLMEQLSFQCFLKKALRFAVCVGIAAGLSAFLLLPTFFVLKNNMRSFGQSFPESKGMFPLTHILQKFFIGSFDGIKGCLPHIYCGLPALIGLVLYFTCRQIPVRERVITGLLTAFLLFSFWFAPLDFMWHAMDHPSWFPCRYAFLLTFCILTSACEGFVKVERNRDILSACAAASAVFLLSCVFNGKRTTGTVVVNLLFLALYAGAVFIKQGRKLCFCVILSAELLVNGMMVISGFSGGYTRLSTYRDFHEHYRQLAEAVQPAGNDFYRMEKRTIRNYNDPLSIGFAGVSHFSSTASTRQAEFLKRLGFNCYATWCTYEGATAVTDALLRVRYEFGAAGKQDSIAAGNETWQHPAQFPLFFFAEDSFARYDFMADVNAVMRQNELMKLLSAPDAADYFEELPVSVSSLENLSVTKDGTYRRIDPEKAAAAELQVEPAAGRSLYLFIPGASLNVTVTVEGDELMNGNRDYAPFPICLDAYTSDGPVRVHVELLKDRLNRGFRAYALDTDALAGLAETLTLSAPAMERTGETSFRLTMEGADEERLIVSSIPFDAGWQVKADGKRLPLKMIHESVLGFILPSGCSAVEVSYQPYGGKIGLILSGCALMLWAGLLVYERSGIKKKS